MKKALKGNYCDGVQRLETEVTVKEVLDKPGSSFGTLKLERVYLFLYCKQTQISRL